MKDAVICGNNIDEKEYLKYIAKYSEYYNIVGIIDEKIDGNKIKRLADVPVLNIRLENVKLFCIVADKEWDIISSRLLAIGKEKHIDFEAGWYLEHNDKNCIRYEYLIALSKDTNVSIVKCIEWFANGRKIASVFGNCQSFYVVDMLCRVDEFIEKYMLVKLPMIAWAPNEIKKNGFDESVLKCFDIFIYQYIKDDNKFSKMLASSVILNTLKKNALDFAFQMHILQDIGRSIHKVIQRL